MPLQGLVASRHSRESGIQESVLGLMPAYMGMTFYRRWKSRCTLLSRTCSPGKARGSALARFECREARRQSLWRCLGP